MLLKSVFMAFGLSICLGSALASEHTPPPTNWESLESIERYVESHPEKSPEQVLQQFESTASRLQLDSPHAIAAALESELPLGIPAFFWGCCFGLLGVILVILVTDNDKSQTKKALYGCLTATGTAVLLYLILLISGAAWVSFS